MTWAALRDTCPLLLLWLNCSPWTPGDPAWGRLGAGADWAGAWGAGASGAGDAVPKPDGDPAEAGTGARPGGPGRGRQAKEQEDHGIQTCGEGGTGVQVWGWGCGSWVCRAATARFSLGNWGQMWGSWEGLLLTLDLPQRLAELLLDREPAPLLPEAPAKIPSEGASHHLALQLANAKAQLRRLRQEL